MSTLDIHIYSTFLRASSIGIFLILAIINSDMTAYTSIFIMNITGKIDGL